MSSETANRLSSTAMRNPGGIVIGGLWALLLSAYTAPLWLPSWDFAVSLHVPGGRWMALGVLVAALLLPPLVLGVLTWQWLTR